MAGKIEGDEYATFPPLPVTVTHLPVTRCQLCDRTLAYRPGNISEVLTEHYRRAHPEALGIPTQQRGQRPARPPIPPQTSARPKEHLRRPEPQARQQSRSVVTDLGGERAKSRYARRLALTARPLVTTERSNRLVAPGK